MKFSPGEKVRFLNEKGEGIVSRIINKTTVAVIIEDGFEIPFAVSELVSIFTGIETGTVKETEVPQVVSTPGARKKEEREGIYIAVNPENPGDPARTGFNLWLVNHTPYEITYCLFTETAAGSDMFEKADASPFTTKIAASIRKSELDDFSSIKVDVLFYAKKKFDHRMPVSEVVKLRQARLYKENAFTENPFIPEKALIINVAYTGKELFFDKPESKDLDLSAMLFQKKQPQSGSRHSVPHIKNNPDYDMEIDLHIEELIDNYEGMSNAEIVVVQLRHFQDALDRAVNAHCRTLTVIHGVGNGRLKTEVRNILSKGGFRYHDASYARYGFGATEVVIG